MGKFSKKSKKFYCNKIKRPPNQAVIKANMKGFLCTCPTNSEDRCAEEAMTLLQEFANDIYGQENHEMVAIAEKTDQVTSNNDSNKIRNLKEESQDSEDSDIESSLKAELEDLRNKKSVNSTNISTSKQRFERVYIHVNNSVFIATTLEDPVKLSVAIMNHIKETKLSRTKVLCRMIPVHKTCKSYLLDIEKAAEELLLEHLPRRTISFCIMFNFKNNNSIKKDDLLPKLSDFASRINPTLKISFITPDIVLNISVMQRICCLSLLPEFLTTYHKYNLQLMATKMDNVHTEISDKNIAVTSCDLDSANKNITVKHEI